MLRKSLLLATGITLVLTPVLAAGESLADLLAREHAGESPEPSPLATAPPAEQVATSTVTYATLDGEPVEGYLATPEGEGPWPGILVIHEWWGLNDNIRAMARRLAGEGYAALAVDLYRGRSAETSEGARELVNAVSESPGEAEENLRQAYRHLVEERDAPAVGVIGWCFGGGWSLRTALLLPEAIDATVIYYGRPVLDREELATLQMPILGIFGEEDQGIPVETARQLEAALEELDKDAEIHVYEGADHAFANPSGSRYHEEAAEDAWRRTLAFFDEHLR